MVTSNVGLGKVIMATDYNNLDGPFTASAEMLNYQYSDSAAPTENAIHGIECAKSENPLSEYWIRTGSESDSVDNRFDDMGTFYIATEGMSVAGQIIGELWVTYDIELLKPRMVAQLGLDALNVHYSLASTTGATMFGNEPAVFAGGPLSVTVTPSSLTFNNASEGIYLIQIYYSSASSGTVPTIGVARTNCVPYGYYLSGSADTILNPSTGVSSVSQYVYNSVVRLTAQNAVLTYTVSSSWEAVWNGDLIITVLTTPNAPTLSNEEKKLERENAILTEKLMNQQSQLDAMWQHLLLKSKCHEDEESVRKSYESFKKGNEIGVSRPTLVESKEEDSTSEFDEETGLTLVNSSTVEQRSRLKQLSSEQLKKVLDQCGY